MNALCNEILTYHRIGRNGSRSLSNLSEAFSSRLVAIRRRLHMNPEVGFKECQTAEYIRSVLEEHHFEVNSAAGTGLYIDIEGRHPGPYIGYRADIDALPITDVKRVSYASRNEGVAHLCGHDVHTTIAIGVALLLQQMPDDIYGNVRVFFQPNEEGAPSGAPAMIRDGVIEELEAAYAIHVDPTLEVGKYGLITGPATGASDQFSVSVKAESTGHSARPHTSADTIWLATKIVQEYYQLIGRITDSRNPAILTLCRFHGGEAYNVIPSKVEFGGTLRTTSSQDRFVLLRQIERIAHQIGSLYHVNVIVNIIKGAPSVINDGDFTKNVESTIRSLYGDEAVFMIPRPSMGAEDFAHYLEHIPGVLVRVGTSSSPETSYPLHDAKFDIDEFAMAPAALA